MRLRDVVLGTVKSDCTLPTHSPPEESNADVRLPGLLEWIDENPYRHVQHDRRGTDSRLSHMLRIRA
jgi:hypothetical protein